MITSKILRDVIGIETGSLFANIGILMLVLLEVNAVRAIVCNTDLKIVIGK